ncbi:hypothetical protein BX616_007711, partial [Lobosporangium transversale]
MIPLSRTSHRRYHTSNSVPGYLDSNELSFVVGTESATINNDQPLPTLGNLHETQTGSSFVRPSEQPIHPQFSRESSLHAPEGPCDNYRTSISNEHEHIGHLEDNDDCNLNEATNYGLNPETGLNSSNNSFNYADLEDCHIGEDDQDDMSLSPQTPTPLPK